MKNLRDTQDTMTMKLLNSGICIISQDKPYENTDLLVQSIIRYDLDNDFNSFKQALDEILVKVEIVTKHADGVLMRGGEKIGLFIYISSLSEKRFTVNGRTNLRESMHTSVLKTLKKMGIIDDNRLVQDHNNPKVVLPARAGLQG